MKHFGRDMAETTAGEALTPGSGDDLMTQKSPGTMISRRGFLAAAGAAAAVRPSVSLAASHMDWWTQARFGMFIHWGVHTIIARDIWNMEHEAIPTEEYMELGKKFRPPVGCARTWARLAREAGQKYMVLTTKNHDGYCLFDTKTTSFCATKQACGRDLVAEFVEAARAEGRRVGFYFSMMDWIRPTASAAQWMKRRGGVSWTISTHK